MVNLITKLKTQYPKTVWLFFYSLIGTAVFLSSYLYASQDIAPNMIAQRTEYNADYNPPVIDDFSYRAGAVHEGKSEPSKDSEAIVEYKNVPVLIYHYVKDNKTGSDLVMTRSKFREQMKYLKDNNYSTINLDELYSHFKDGRELPQKPVVVTIDDGYEEIYKNAYPILKELKIKATVFMITGNIDKRPDYLNSRELIEMQGNGIDIQSHTVGHEKLDELSYAHQLATLQNSRAALEKLLNKEVRYIAYPYGAYNDDTLKAARDAGYKMALSGKRGMAEKSDGLYELKRIYIGRMDSMKLFKRVLNGDFSLK